MRKRRYGQKRRVNVYHMLCGVFLIVLAVVLVFAVRSESIRRRAQRQYTQLAAQVNTAHGHLEIVSEDDTTNSTEEIEDSTEQISDSAQILESLGMEIPTKTLDWDMIHQVNSDIYAWIYIPGTKVDYPVLQHPTDDKYYLEYNMDGSKGRPGCIFTQGINSEDFTDCNTVIYGHNMHDGTMFHTLHNFEDASFFDENRYVYIYTEETVLVYEIFAAYTTDNSNIMYTNDLTTEEGYADYIASVYTDINEDDKANLRRTISVSTSDCMITLSTCVRGQNTKRYLVQAVLLRE
jgi:sortase B